MGWFNDTKNVLKERSDLSGKETAVVVVFLFVVALLLRMRLMSGGVLWLDEGYTIILSKLSFGELLARGPCDANPVLSSRLYSWWSALFGGSISSYESLAVVFGALTIPAVAYLGYILFNARIALWSAFLLGTSGFHIQYSQFVRIYAFAVLFSVLAAIFLVRFLKGRSKLDAFFFLFSCLVLANSHYIGLLVVATFFVYGLASESRAKRGPVAMVGLGIIFSFLYLPTLFQLYEQYVVDNRASWIKEPQFETAVSLWYFLSSESVALLIPLLSTAVFGVFAVKNREDEEGGEWFDESHQVMLLLVWLMWPFFVMFAASFLAPSFFHARYFIFLLVPFLMLVSFGLSKLPLSLDVIVLFPILTVVSANVVTDYYYGRLKTESEKFNYEMLEHNLKPGDVVVHSSKCSFVPSMIYTGGLADEYLLKDAGWTRVLQCGEIDERRILFQDLKKYKRMWVVHRDCYPERASSMLFKSKPFKLLNPKFIYESRNGELSLFEIQPDKEKKDEVPEDAENGELDPQPDSN